MDDPKDTRMIQTRDGVARVPRSQVGVPIREYFQNTELPKDLDRAQVFVSASGPVLATPDPVPWSEMHEQKAQGYADALKEQIDEKGYYKRTLATFAGRLSEETGYPRQEMQAVIVSKFNATYEKDPFAYLQSVREAQGLPVRERGLDQGRSYEPDMS